MNVLDDVAELAIPKELLALKLSWASRALGAYIFLHPETPPGSLTPAFGTPGEVSWMLAQLDREGGGKGGVLLKSIKTYLLKTNSNPSPLKAISNAQARETGEAGAMSAGLEYELAEALNRSPKAHLHVPVRQEDGPRDVAHLLCSRFVKRCEEEGFDFQWPHSGPEKKYTSRAVLAVSEKVVAGPRSVDVLITGILRNDWLMTKCGALWPYVAKHFDKVYCSGLRRIGETALPYLRERYARVERRYVRAIEDRDWEQQQRFGELLGRINGDIKLFVRADGGRAKVARTDTGRVQRAGGSDAGGSAPCKFGDIVVQQTDSGTAPERVLQEEGSVSPP